METSIKIHRVTGLAKAVLAACMAAGLILAGSGSGLAAVTSTIKTPLDKLVPFGVADLRGDRGSIGIKVPVPARWEVRSARLHASYTHSSALVGSRSQLVIRVNGFVAAQTPLLPESSRGELDVDIPPGLLKPAYNDLEFSVAQNYTEKECSDPNAPELWTSLEIAKSYLEIEYSLRDVPISLAAISDFLFDPRIMGTNRCHVITADLSEDNLQLAALVAAGVAIRFDYRPVRFTISDRVVPGMDNIVIGDPAFVSKISGLSGQDIPSGQVGITALPDPDREGGIDPGLALIHVTGKTPEDVLNAARAFALFSFPMTDAASTRIGRVTWPEIDRYSGKSLVSPGEKYTLGDLGFRTHTFRGFNPETLDVTFRLPSDQLFQSNHVAELSLDLAFGASMRTDSVLNILLNDEFAAAIPLNDERGGRYQGYKVLLPMYLFKGGYNTLTFSPVLTPLKTDRCTLIQTQNLVLSLHDGSTFKLPEMRHWIDLPRLELFFQDGFPLARRPDWHGSTVVLVDDSAETAATALNLVAMVGQKTGVPPFGIRFSPNTSIQAGTDTLIVGTLNEIPEEVMKAAGLSPESTFPFYGRKGKNKSDRTWWDRLFPDEFDVKPPLSPSAGVEMKAVFGKGRLLIAQFESPASAGKTAILVAAARAEDLPVGAYALWKPAVQGQCRGGMALVDLTGPKERVYARTFGKSYFVGSLGRFDRLDYLIHTYAWQSYTILVICVLLLAFIIHRLLRRYRARRIKEERLEADA